MSVELGRHRDRVCVVASKVQGQLAGPGIVKS